MRTEHSPSPCGRGLGGGGGAMIAIPLDTRLRIGIQTIHRRTEPATGPWLPAIDELVELVELVDRSGYDSLWVGDHISFAVPVLDPLLQLAQAAMASRRLTLGTSVYLLPLRHPAAVAKQRMAQPVHNTCPPNRSYTAPPTSGATSAAAANENPNTP